MEAIYYVSAYASKNGLALSQKATTQKSNEITAIPILLFLIDCKRMHHHRRRSILPNRHC
ncbi:MAG: hypothetical protein SNJ77_00775 [Cytophagales bacterium]